MNPVQEALAAVVLSWPLDKIDFKSFVKWYKFLEKENK